ncbi:hypothetical protein EYF80_051758 [Liparis tanakae]|uniref:Uncharacterized protein n=1 Tax=Liparis tanakae TaxID=230148 RepID=A0A4Z2FB19_9TELE|nr:hypothetical protein EYF80_051758 [Liparis tanakae]
MRFSMYCPRTWFSDLSFRFSSLTASTRAERSGTKDQNSYEMNRMHAILRLPGEMGAPHPGVCDEDDEDDDDDGYKLDILATEPQINERLKTNLISASRAARGDSFVLASPRLLSPPSTSTDPSPVRL